jgi:hypothetical protein
MTSLQQLLKFTILTIRDVYSVAYNGQKTMDNFSE